MKALTVFEGVIRLWHFRIRLQRGKIMHIQLNARPALILPTRFTRLQTL